MNVGVFKRWMPLAGALIAGCAIGVAGTLAFVGAPTASKATPAPTSTVLDPAFPAAKTPDELAVFKASRASCDLINSKGARFTLGAGGSQDVAPVVSDTGEKMQGSIVRDSAGKVVTTWILADAPAYPCYPDATNQQALARGVDAVAAGFLLETNPETAGTYVWHGHMGSSSVGNLHLVVVDGVITQFDEPANDYEGTGYVTDIRYGLTQTELDEAQRFFFPNN